MNRSVLGLSVLLAAMYAEPVNAPTTLQSLGRLGLSGDEIPQLRLMERNLGNITVVREDALMTQSTRTVYE